MPYVYISFYITGLFDSETFRRVNLIYKLFLIYI